MALSTQRLVFIVMGINLMLGIVGSIYENATTYSNEVLANELLLYEDYEDEFFDEDKQYSGVKKDNLVQDVSIGSSLNWGKILLDIFRHGINPFSINPTQFETYVEQIASSILMLFRVFMMVLVVIEAIMIFLNRKSS